MRQKNLFMTGALALALTFTVALVGCATNGGGDSLSGEYSFTSLSIIFSGGIYEKKVEIRDDDVRVTGRGSFTVSGKKVTLSDGDVYTIKNATTIKDKEGNEYHKIQRLPGGARVLSK